MKLTRRSVLRGSAVAVAAPAAGYALASPRLAAAAPPPRQPQHAWRHGLSLFDELKYPAGFKHFDYVNPQAPKGGTVRMIAIGTFDNFNMAVSGVRGSLAAGIEPRLQHADGGRARRGVHRIRAAGRSGQPSAGFLVGDLSPARRCALARRQAGHGRGRDLLARGIQEASPAIRRLLPACDQGREDRRARRHLHLRRPRQPRAAADRRPALRAAQALVGRHRRATATSATSARPRSSRRSAPAPTGSSTSSPAAPSSTSG